MSGEVYVNPRSARGNQGCWSCRFRKKRCQRTDPNDPVCDDCRRFNMECIGSNEERPRRPGLSREARDVLKEWIKTHTKDTPDSNEEPLSIRYLWDRPPRASSSSQRGAQEIQPIRDHRRSHSATSTYSVSSQASGFHATGSTVMESEPNPVSSLLLENFMRGGASPSPSSNASTSQTSTSRHFRNLSDQRPPPVLDISRMAYHSQPSQNYASLSVSPMARRVSDPGPNNYATLQIQNQPTNPSMYLSVPNTGMTQVSPHQPLMIFTDERGAHFQPNAPGPWLIPNHIPDSSYQEASPLSSTYLSPSSPYASSIMSSSSSLDDGSWEEGPPSPYVGDDMFLGDSQGSTQSTSSSSMMPLPENSWYQTPMFPPQ